MRSPIPLSLESSVLRAAGSLSRVAGRGGGTTLPGKLLWKLDPGAIDRLAARLEQNPNDKDGWVRLAHAYDVLGETEKAEAARTHAAQVPEAGK